MFKLISLCMIVKNEEELLPRALANLQGFWDELIIVDTGSDDNTIEIARQAGARVLHYDWQAPGHKGDARNAGIDEAEGKWIVVLDADETIQEPVKLRSWLEQCREQAVHVQFCNVEPGNNVSLIWNQMRIFRRGLYRYQYREHELPIPIAEGLNEAVTDFVFIHRQPAERREGKTGPMLNRLMLDVEEQPNDPHPWYFLHRQYAHAQDYDNAIVAGETFLRLADGKDKCECYGNLATCHQAKNEPYKALLYLHRALTDQPTRRIWWARIAELYVQAGQWNIALAYLRGALEICQGPEQHFQPGAQRFIFDMLERCQSEIAHAVAAHDHGGHTH